LQVTLLEQTVEAIRAENGAKFEDLRKLVVDQRAARVRAEAEIEALKKNKSKHLLCN
jgi:hypothetical protein